MDEAAHLPTMKIPISTLGLIFLCACASHAREARPNDLLANGRDPHWFLSVGPSGIHLSFGWNISRPDKEFAFPAAAPNEQDGTRKWESRGNGRVIRIEARETACAAGGAFGTVAVRVRLEDRELNGCGDYDSGTAG